MNNVSMLQKFNITYDKLTEIERETLSGWLHNISQKQTSIEDVKDYIRKMTESVEQELCEHELPRTKDIFLKARLKNYILLSDFLTTPDKAKKSLEQYLQGLKL